MLVTDQATIPLGTVNVAGVPRLFDPPAVDHVMNVNFGGKVLLYGYTLQRNEGKLSLEIVWKSVDNIATDYKVFVHLVSQDGTILAQQDAMPQANQYPTSLWLPGEFVVDPYQLPALDGGAALQIGLYSPDDGIRLPILDNQQNSSGDDLVIPLS